MLSGSSMSRRKWIKYTGIALLLSLVPNNNVATGDTTTLESISPKEAYERVHGHYSVPLIDVRTKEEYASAFSQFYSFLPENIILMVLCRYAHRRFYFYSFIR